MNNSQRKDLQEMRTQAEKFIKAMREGNAVEAAKSMFYDLDTHDDQVSEDYVILIFDDESRCAYDGVVAWEVKE